MTHGEVELILRSGAVLADPGADPGVAPTALAIADGHVFAVGSDAQVGALAGPRTRVVDLDGRTVLPGINDSHLHLSAWAAGQALYADVSAAVTWDEVCRRAAAAPPDAGGWVQLRGWDGATLPDLAPSGVPDGVLLDRLTPGRAVVLFDATGHQVMLNAEARRRCGIDAGTPDPPGGHLVRDRTGTPTGLLREAAVALVATRLPPPGRDRLLAALRQALVRLAALGVTSLTEPGLGPGATSLLDGSGTAEALEALAELARTDELTARINVLLLYAGTGGGTADDVIAGLADLSSMRHRVDGVDPRRLRIAGVKVFGDGIPRSGTAWMSRPYAGGVRGCLCLAGEDDAERVTELSRTVAAVDAAGLQVGCHLIGDAAVSAFLDAVEALPGRGAGRRHYVIHGDYAAPADLVRMASLDVGLNTNPAIRRQAGSLVRDVVGAERHAWQQPIGSALAAGVAVSISSDAPVVEPDWRIGVVAAVTRRTRDTEPPAQDHQAVDVRAALRALTVAPARQDQAEAWKGRLQPGAVADLCVLDGPIPAAERIEDLLSTDVSLTLVGGRQVHRTC